MSLDIGLRERKTCPHCGGMVGTDRSLEDLNITHNLVPMWREAGVYNALYESEGCVAKDYLPALRKGIELMKTYPERFRKLNPSNGWGNYDDAFKWLNQWLAACELYPEAIIRVWR